MKSQYTPQVRFHPGETLGEKLEEMGVSINVFAESIGKSEKNIRAVINGQHPITPDLAVKFENITKIPAHFWLNSQRKYDEFIHDRFLISQDVSVLTENFVS